MQILTNSAIGQFKNCRRAFYYRRVEELALRYESVSRGVGSAVHKGLETGNTEEALRLFDDIFPGDQEEADKLETNRAIVQAMLEGYFDLYGKGWDGEYHPEKQFEISIINPASGATSRSYRLAGKVDGLLKQDGRWWLVEYKTAGMIDKNYIDKLMLDQQLTTYIYALQRQEQIKISGVIYRMLRKPSIRQRKNETIGQFIERLTQDYKDRPEFYFFEEQLYRSQEDLDEFEREIWDITQDLLKCRREGLWYRNTSRCKDWGGCEYLPLCTQQPDAADLFVKRQKNIELEGDDGEDVA